MEWALFGSTFVVSFVIIVIVTEHLRQKRKLALRQIIQKERMAALERGLQLPESGHDLLDEDHAAMSSSESYRRKVQWFCFTSLSVGLFVVFGGIGFYLGMNFSPDGNLNSLASLGSLPHFRS
jgi:hypothetical protein